MNLRQEHKLNMYNVTSGFTNATDVAIINQMPRFTAVHTKFRVVVDQIQAASQVQAKHTTAYTRQRDAFREPAEQQVKEITRRVTVFAIDTENVELEGLMKFGRQEFERMTDKQFVSKVNAVIKIVEPITADTADYGVTADIVAQLQQAVDKLEVYLPQPRAAVVKRAYSTAEISALFKEANRLLRILDKYVAMLEFKEPAFYGMYSMSRNIMDPATHKRSIVGVVKGEQGNPLHGVRISIDGKTSILTNEAGTFHSAHLPNGEHTVAFALTGYHDHIANVIITSGKRAELDIVLQSL